MFVLDNRNPVFVLDNRNPVFVLENGDEIEDKLFTDVFEKLRKMRN